MLFYVFLSTISLMLLSPTLGLTPLLSLLLILWVLLLLKITSVSSHVLLVLLMLEFLMLLFLLLLLNLNNNLFTSSNLVLSFFTLAVCEASLGLGLLIALSRKFGSQALSIF